MNLQHIRHLARFTLALGALAIADPSVAAEPTPTMEGTEVVANQGWNTPAAQERSIKAGRELLADLTAARDRLKANDVLAAAKDIRAGSALLGTLEEAEPFVAVVDQVGAAKAKINKGDSAFFFDDLLPIYANLDEVATYAPEVAAHARKHVERAEMNARKGDKRGAERELRNVEDELTASTVYLPVDYVAAEVHSAKQALARKTPNVKAAERAIDNALGSATVVVNTWDTKANAG